MGTSSMILLLLVCVGCVLGDSFRRQLEEAEAATTKIMDGIYAEWEVDKYPNFLKSAWMPRHSWDRLVTKFEQRLLAAAEHNVHLNFTISFTGSSVTAGHDSPFAASFPVVCGETMAPAFAPLNIKLVSENVAMGNNPCMPYDACVATFAGPDADIVHWEQQFNCWTDYQPRGVEQFIRQSLFMPSGPIVVLAGSETPLWKPEDCNNVKPHALSAEEKDLVAAASLGLDGLRKIFTDLNKSSRGRWGGDLHKLVHAYPQSSIQVFDHTGYEQYKGLGPYVKEWSNGLGGWHPSVLGHKLRAHHHAYVWLAAWKVAVTKVKDAYVKGGKVGDMLATVTTVINTVKMPPEPMTTPVVPRSDEMSDNIQCYTTYEPHRDREKTLHNLIVSGYVEGNNDVEKGWVVEILETFVQASIVESAKKQGYRDKKYMLYGNKKSGPLHLHITTKREGYIFLCEPPGVWGALPATFDHLWESDIELYMTPLINGVTIDNFKFERSPKIAIPYRHLIIDEICTRIPAKFPPGQYVLTLLPTKEDNKVMLSTVLVP